MLAGGKQDAGGDSVNTALNIRVTTAVAKAQRDLALLRQRVRELESQVGSAGSAATRAFSGNAMTALSKWGSQVQWAGRQLVTNFTLPLGLAGVAGTKMALDVEAGMVRVKKVYGDAQNGARDFAKDVDGLSQAFELLSVKYAESQADVIDIAGDWAAAGATGGALARGVEETLRVMTLGEMEAADATEALIAIQAQYGANTKELSGIIDVLNATENQTGVTFKGLVEGMSRSASSARSAGVDVDHLAAMIASISPAAGSAGQAGNALKTIFSRLQGPTNEAREVLGLMGIDIDDVGWKSLNGAQRLERLADAYMHLEGAGEGMISSQAGIVSAVVASRWQINRFDVLMRDLASKVDNNSETNGYYGKTLDTLKNKSEVAAIAQQELQAVLESNPEQMKRAGTIIQNSLIKVIASIMPQIMSFVNVIASLADAFANMNPMIQQTIIVIAALLAVLGPPMVLLGSLGVAIGQIGNLLGGAGRAFKKFFGITKAAEKMDTSAPAKRAEANRVSVTKMIADEQRLANQRMTLDSQTARAQASSIRARMELEKAQIAQRIAGEREAARVARVEAFNEASARASVVEAKIDNEIRAARAVQTTKAQEVAAYQSAAGREIAIIAATTTEISTLYSAMYARMAGSAAAWAGAEAAAVRTANAAHHAGLIMLQQIYARSYTAIEQSKGVIAARFEAQRAQAQAAANLAILAEQAAMAKAYAANYALLGAAAANGFRAGFFGGMQAIGPAPVLRQIGAATPAVTAASTAMGVTAGRGASAGFRVGIMGGFKRAGSAVVGAVGKIGPMIVAGFTAILPLLARVGTAIVAAMTGPIGIAVATVAGLIFIFRKQIAEAWDAIVEQVRTDGTNLNNAVRGIADLWNSLVRAIARAFQALPEAVRAPLVAVVTMIRDAALAVYEWFSYINPFAHHSPSLVENVTNGMRIVGNQFGLAAGKIKNHMMNAYSSLKMFGNATKTFMANYAKAMFAADKALVAKHAGASQARAMAALNRQLPPLYSDLEKVNGAIERQEKRVAALQGALDSAQSVVDSAQDKFDSLNDTLQDLGDRLDSAQSKLDGFADMPIKGMKAMNDAIFDNEMAQKRLQLELLKMGDVDISDLESKLSSLQGEIEMLRGEQASLRMAGAGSEILAAYDKQIGELEKQQGVIEESVKPMNDLQNQLEELQKAGQILDLENSLKFDPLTKQVDELANSYEELPFGQILSGIKSQKKVVDELQSSYDAQNKKVEYQQVVLDNANKALDAAQKKYDAQKAVLDGLQTTYDAIAESINNIETAINDVVAAAEEMRSALEAAKAAGRGGGSGSDDRLTPAGQNFLGAAGGAFPDVGGASTIGDESFGISEWLEQFANDNADLFSGLDVFSGIKAAWSDFKGWWGSNVSPVFSGLWNGLKEIVTGIDWVAAFTTPWNALVDWIKGDSVLATTLRAAWDGAVDGVLDAWNGVKERLGPILDELKEPIDNLKSTFSELVDNLRARWNEVWPELHAAWQRFQPVLGVMLNVFKTVFGVIGTVIALAVSIAWNLFTNVLAPAFGFVATLVANLLEVFTGFITFFTGVFTGEWRMAWEGIKQIFTGTWDAIVGVLTGMWDIVVGIVTGMVEGVVEWFEWLYDILVGHSIVPDLVNAIISWFGDLWDKVIEFVTGLVVGVVEWFAKLYTKAKQKIVDLVVAAVLKFREMRDDIKAAAQAIWDNVVNKFQEIKSSVINKVKELVLGVVKWFKELPDRIRNGIGNLGSTIKSKATDLMGGFNTGVLDKWKAVKSWFGGLGALVVATVGNMSNKLKNAGWNIINGFFNGLKDRWDDVKGWVTGIGDWIADHKGPKAYDLALLVPAGNWIMTGLQEGLKDQIPNLERTLGGVSDTIFNSMEGTRAAAMQSLRTDAAMYASRANDGGTGHGAAVVSTQDNRKSFNFYGDLSFPNITDPDDAGKFLQNLEDLVVGGEG